MDFRDDNRAGVSAAGSASVNGGGRLLVLAPDCSPKRLEEPCLYNRATDELYIINDDALTFLKRCGNGVPVAEAAGESEFVEFCLEEGILDMADEAQAARRDPHVRQSPLPSLRYLLLHITERCNLKCRHCFLGEAGRHELGIGELTAIADQLEEMQGLRLLVSGGEPLLHPEFQKLNDHLAGKDLRTVLMSNGTLIDEEIARRLAFREVQISLDGMRAAHDYMRGRGTFDRSVAAIDHLRRAGIDVSVATMVHARNLEDFDELEELVHGLSVREWSIDAPSPVGRMALHRDLLVDPRRTGALIDRSFGGAIHEPAPGFACGAHLMAVMADGSAAACGFYAHEPVGTATEGLETCWQRLARHTLADLQCDCEFLEECRGGCRFRATAAGGSHGNEPDLCQCYRYGVLI